MNIAKKYNLIICLLLNFGFIQITNAQNPNWSVNSASYPLDASIIGALKIDGEYTSNTNNLIAAFDENNTIRGLAKLSFIAALNKYVFFMTIYENKGGTTFSFRVYDANQDIVVLVPRTSIKFTPNEISGSLDNPFLIEAETNILPSVKTFLATNITTTQANLRGEVIAQGKSLVIERGFIYSTEDSYPKIGEPDVLKILNGSNLGEFTNLITNLNTGKHTYFYRAFATNSLGTSYGEVLRFSINNSLNFDKIDDSVLIPDTNTFDFSNGLSVDLMLYPTSFSETSTIMSQYANTDKSFLIVIKTGGVIEVSISTDGTSEMTYTSNLRVVQNKWQHLTVTYQNDGSLKLYINGTEDVLGNTTNPQNGTIHNSNQPILIGAKENQDFYKGTLDEIRIWNKPLSSAIIKTIQNKAIPKNMTGLLAYYNCNQGITNGNNTTITQLLDKTVNNLNGSLQNFAKNGTSSNFITGISGDFDNNQVAQNEFITNGNWSNPNNWLLGIVPQKIDNVSIKDNQIITIDIDNLEVDELILGNNATLQIPKDKSIIINNKFISNGLLELDSDKNESGVLLINGTTSGTITYKRGGLLANKWSIVTPPVSGQTIKSFAENAANDIRINTTPNPNRYAIATYDDSNSAGQKWVYYTENLNINDTFIAGQSYSMSRATDGSVSFTGILNVVNLKKPLIAGQWNAIGNPFTTYYPANKNSSNSFLNDNFDVIDDTFKSLYIWDNSQNKYVAVAEVSETAKSLPPGQGFFIKLKNTANEINFLKDKRTLKPISGNTTFEKEKSKPSITLKATSKKTTVTTEIKFFDNSTDGFDAGYDIGNFNGATFDIYTKIVDSEKEEDTNFTIQSLPNDILNTSIIPIEIIGKKEQEITITAKTANLPKDIHLYLEDKVKNSFTNLTNESEQYQFTFNNNVSNIGRFFLHTLTKVLNTNTNELLTESIYANKNTLFVNGLQSDAILKIHSLLGKQVLSKKIIANSLIEISIKNLITGIYIVDITNKKRKVTKKIIIE